MSLASAVELTPAWLTRILRRQGALQRGQVTSVTLQSRKELFVSVVSHLKVTYSADASEDAPRYLFLKTPPVNSATARACEEEPAEIIFYREVANKMAHAALAPCYDAAYTQASGQWHLLLQDLTETHVPVSGFPSFAQCALAVASLAQIHAHWWEHPQLGTSVGRFLTTAEVDGLARRTAVNHERFAAAIGDRLSPDQQLIFTQVLATFPQPWIRLSAPRGLTLTHGDAHVWNFLYPRAADGRAILVDWQLWHIHIGPRDLAYMMTLSWPPERRAEMEKKLVYSYHQALIARDVRNYSWDQCWKDYRWSALRNIFIPAWQWRQGMDLDFCWARTLRALAAFTDLGCAELIER